MYPRLDPKLLNPIRHRGEAAQQHLAVVRARDVVVGARTALINHARGAVKAVGSRLSGCSAHSFVYKVARHVPPELQAPLAPVLESIGELTVRIRAYDREIERLCGTLSRDRAAQAGRGGGSAHRAGLCAGARGPEPLRAQPSGGPYLGLRPKRSDSGQARPQLRISKGGDELLRKLLVQSAHYVVGPFGPDTDLKRWGLRLAARGGKNAKKRAVTAVARKLAVLLHRLWISGADYEPLRHERVEASA